jgi:hypothetical protein
VEKDSRVGYFLSEMETRKLLIEAVVANLGRRETVIIPERECEASQEEILEFLGGKYGAVLYVGS